MISVPEHFLHALTQLHVAEKTAKNAQNDVIVAYWKEAAIMGPVNDDETPWCAAFVGAMLKRGGIDPSHRGTAKSYARWGDEATGVGLIGAVVVLNRAPPAPDWQGHVGFCCGMTKDNVHVLGGNQGNRVSIAAFPRMRINTIRMPKGVKLVGSGLLLPVSQSSPTVS